MINYYDALYQLYPNIVRTLEDTAYDVNDNVVEYNKSAVEDKLVELQAAETAKQEAEITAKASAQAKLAALGLTADEVKAILGTT
jgi:hypothetical protein